MTDLELDVWDAWLRAVSYTHLDVYKRQIWNSILASVPEKACTVSYPAFCNAVYKRLSLIHIYTAAPDNPAPVLPADTSFQ